eukprot:366546-Chlamydomonas_euryale.AAC.22
MLLCVCWLVPQHCFPPSRQSAAGAFWISTPGHLPPPRHPPIFTFFMCCPNQRRSLPPLAARAAGAYRPEDATSLARASFDAATLSDGATFSNAGERFPLPRAPQTPAPTDYDPKPPVSKPTEPHGVGPSPGFAQPARPGAAFPTPHPATPATAIAAEVPAAMHAKSAPASPQRAGPGTPRHPQARGAPFASNTERFALRPGPAPGPWAYQQDIPEQAHPRAPAAYFDGTERVLGQPVNYSPPPGAYDVPTGLVTMSHNVTYASA